MSDAMQHIRDLFARAFELAPVNLWPTMRQELSKFIGSENNEHTRYEINGKIAELLTCSMSREEVPLSPGEKPNVHLHLPPRQGFRWENDDELRAKIARKLENRNTT